MAKLNFQNPPNLRVSEEDPVRVCATQNGVFQDADITIDYSLDPSTAASTSQKAIGYANPLTFPGTADPASFTINGALVHGLPGTTIIQNAIDTGASIFCKYYDAGESIGTIDSGLTKVAAVGDTDFDDTYQSAVTAATPSELAVFYKTLSAGMAVKDGNDFIIIAGLSGTATNFKLISATLLSAGTIATGAALVMPKREHLIRIKPSSNAIGKSGTAGELRGGTVSFTLDAEISTTYLDP